MANVPTDFFDRQAAAKSRTGLLVFYFCLAIIGIVASIYMVVMMVFIVSQKGAGDRGAFALWDPGILAGVSALVVLTVAGGSAYKTASLAAGGEVVALELGGRLLNPQTTDRAERRLLNVIEEMALASGVPVPPVYVMDQEQGINAFAAGMSPGDAVIGVTAGALRHLSRDELQGVLGHEFSHILNGDMRLNLRLMGLLAGILLLSTIGYIMFRIAAESGPSHRSRSDDEEKKADPRIAIILLGLALVVIGWVGVFFGRLIKAAIARQRERLADASAVQFTRNPSGLAGALKKIGGLAAGSKITNPHAEEASHMFFEEGISTLTNLLATHPPLIERIRLLEPQFDGVFPEVGPLDEPLETEPAAPSAGSFDRLRKAFPGMQGVALPGAGGGAGSRFPFDPAAAIALVGAAEPEHIDYARDLLAGIPPELADAARETYGARALVYCLLLDRDASVRKVQLEGLQGRVEEGLWQSMERLFPQLQTIGEEVRLPLASLAIPSLKSLVPPQYASFRANVDALIDADNRVDLFELSLRRLLVRRLDRIFLPAQKERPITNDRLAKACSIVLARLAAEGAPDEPRRARSAFSSGVGKLPELFPQAVAGDIPQVDFDFRSLDNALDVIERTPPKVKRRVVEAAFAVIAADGAVTPDEAELIRAVAGALECPLPPFLRKPAPQAASPSEASSQA